MLTPNQFRSRWEAEVVASDPLPDDCQLVCVPRERLSGFRLSRATQEFLSEAGLPRACAPCLSFEEVGKGLLRLWDVFAPRQWQPTEKTGLEHYLMIGSDGAGNPFCIDERDGRVVMLDHELLFDVKRRDKRTMFVNSGIPEFAESLLVYQNSDEGAHRLAIEQIDPPAIQKGAFWSYENAG